MSVTEFASRLDHFQLFMYNFALRLTQNPEKAKDLVQDTSLRAYRYRANFQAGTNFKGWIATVMRNLFVNQYRKDQKRKVVSEPVENFAFALESKVITPNAGEVNLRMQELHRILKQIGELYSTPFLMHFQGYEYKEIAEKLDTPIGTIKSRIFTARKKMQTLIQSRYNQDIK